MSEGIFLTDGREKCQDLRVSKTNGGAFIAYRNPPKNSKVREGGRVRATREMISTLM